MNPQMMAMLAALLGGQPPHPQPPPQAMQNPIMGALLSPNIPDTPGPAFMSDVDKVRAAKNGESLGPSPTVREIVLNHFSKNSYENNLKIKLGLSPGNSSPHLSKPFSGPDGRRGSVLRLRF